jgi:hypothetical protein
MDKIEVGEHVRTDYGEIHKVVNIVEDDGDWNYYTYENDMGDFQLSIVKHSKQLIDLIETGDYINGMEVLDVYKPRDVWEPVEIRVDSRYTNFILTEDIKTILTKEQYMANCYKVGGEDE